MGKLQKAAQYARDPRWLKFFLQRRFQNPNTRDRISNTLTKLRPAANINDAAYASIGGSELKKSGLFNLGKLLSPDQCEEVRSYFENREVHDPYRPSVPPFGPLSDARPKEAHIAHHSAKDIVNAPYLMDIANDPKILDVVGEFLGCKPTIGYLATWWSYPTSSGPQQAENFHRDVDDWKFVKLFLYLTEVGPENGPHKYVVHSSSKPVHNKIRRYTDEEVADAFGEDNIKVMTSAPGEAFLEDTYGFHKGQPLQAGHRLLFQVVYTLNPLPYGPKVPIAKTQIERNSFDKWTNRVYFK